MTLRAVKLVLVGAWVFALLQAYGAMEARYREAPLAASASVVVTSWDGVHSAQDLYRDLARFTSTHRIAVAREVGDFSDGRTVRRLFLASAAHDEPRGVSQWTEDFASTPETVVRPIAELDSRSPVGEYYVFGDDKDAQALQRFLGEKGVTAEVATLGRFSGVPPDWRTGIFVFLLLCAGIAATHAVSTVRTSAIHRLHGVPWRRTLGQGTASYLPYWLIAGVVLVPASATLLLARGTNSGLGSFLIMATAISGASLASAIIGYSGVHALLQSVEIPSALKGKLPAGGLTVCSYALRITAAFIALGAAVTCLRLGANVAEHAEHRSEFEALGQRASITLGNAYTRADQQRLTTVVGGWLRSLDRDDQILLSAQQDLTPMGPAWVGTSSLMVNDQYLETQSVELVSGGAAHSGPGDQVSILVPTRLWEHRRELPGVLGLDTLVEPGSSPRYNWLETTAGQRLFTYSPQQATGSDSGPQPGTATYLTDAVVVVWPSHAGWLRDESYAAFASSGGVTFESTEFVQNATARDQELQTFVRAATPLASRAATALAEDQSAWRRSLFLVIVAALVLVMSGVAAALIYSRSKSQQIFVRFAHGWRAGKIYRIPLAVEAGLLLVIALWIPVSVLRDRSDFQRAVAQGAVPPLSPPSMAWEQWAAILALGITLAGGFLISLTSTHRQVVARTISDR